MHANGIRVLVQCTNFFCTDNACSIEKGDIAKPFKDAMYIASMEAAA